MMSLKKRVVSLSILAALCITCLTAPAAQAAGPKDVLSAVPGDAWGFVVLRSLETVDQKAALLNKMLDLGLPPQVTPMALGMMNLGTTVDMKSPVCIVLMDVQKYGAMDPGDAALAIMPTADPKAMVKQLGAGEATEGLFKIAPMGQEAFAAIKDKFLIVGKNKDCVAKAAKAKTNMDKDFAEARSALLGKSDIYLSISVRAALTAYKDLIMPMMQMAMAAQDPDGTKIKKLMKMFMEMEAIDISLCLNEEGFALRALTVAVKDSDFAKLTAATKNTSSSLLSVLPKEKYLLAVGATGGYSEHAEKFRDPNMISGLLKQAQIEGIDDAAAKTLDKEITKLLKAIGPWAFSVSSLPGGDGGMFGLTVAIESEDPKTFVDGLRSIYKTIWKLSDDEDFETVKDIVVHKADAETVDGNKVDTISLNMEEFADMADMDEDDVKQVHKLAGKELVFRFGAAGPKHFVFSFGGGKARFGKVCKSVTSKGGDSLASDKGIAALSAKMPTPRSSEGFIAVDNILHLAKSLAELWDEGDEIPFEVPQLDAPVAICGVAMDNISQADFVVPAKLIKAVKKMIDDAEKAEMDAFDEDDDDDDEDLDEDDDDEDLDEDDDDDEDLDEDDDE